jgi:hypothetical protein
MRSSVQFSSSILRHLSSPAASLMSFRSDLQFDVGFVSQDAGVCERGLLPHGPLIHLGVILLQTPGFKCLCDGSGQPRWGVLAAHHLRPATSLRRR